MGRKKEITFYKDMYLGSMPSNIADEIMNIQNQKVIDSLKNCITNLDDELVEDVIDCALTYNGQPILEEDEIKLGKLRDEQTVGVAYMYTAQRCLLGDGTGMGKTVETAGLINLCKLEKEKNGSQFRYIFLTEKNSMYQIQKKLIKFTGEYVHISTGEADKVEKYISMNRDGVWCSLVANHHIINNTVFFSWLLRNINAFDMIVVDEGYVIKNSTSGISKNIKSVCNMVKRFIILNATPFEKSILDFYTQLNIIDSTLLPTKTDFISEFCVKSYVGFKRDIIGTKNEDVFKKRISLRYFARKRSDNGAIIENNNGHVVFWRLSSDQRYLMSRTSMWRMVCDCPQAIDNDVIYDEISVPKLKELRCILENHKDESVFIFCYYREAQYALSEYLESIGYENQIINGATKTKDLDNIVSEFNKGNFPVLISNKQRGTDIKNCNVIVFYSFDFNSSRMRQTEGRITREFNVVGKDVYLLCSKGREKGYLKEKVLKNNISSEKLMDMDESIIFKELKNIFYKESEV